MAMRVGAEDKKKLAVAVGLGVVVLILLVRFILGSFGSSSPSSAGAPSAAAPVPAPEQAAARPSPTGGASGQQPDAFDQQPYAHEAVRIAASPLDPTLHPEWMQAAESVEYTGSGRNIFSPNSAPPSIPRPIASPRRRPAANQAAVVAQGPPPPPRIDLRFYGYAAERNGHKQVFLLHGDDIFIASEGDVVDRRYRVGKINAASVEVEDLPYHDTQTLPLMQ